MMTRATTKKIINYLFNKIRKISRRTHKYAATTAQHGTMNAIYNNQKNERANKNDNTIIKEKHHELDYQ